MQIIQKIIKRDAQEMLSITIQQPYYIHSSASTSDSDEENSLRLIQLQKNKKLKNELCRNYLSTGFCRYFDKCQFAHGIQQLRQSSKTNLKYKTKECQSYFVKGCCQYGQRCNFMHRKPQDQSTEQAKIRTMRENFREVLDSKFGQSRVLRMLQ